MGRHLSTPREIHRRHDWDEQTGWPALGLILALHAGALWGLMQVDAVREAVQEVAPIMVGLITLPPPEPVKPRLEPPPIKPKPKPRRKPTPKPQMIAAATPAPAPIEVPLPEPIAPKDPPPPPAEPAPPAPVVPPNFLAAYLDNPAPAYPSTSKRLRETGLVMLRVRVAASGRAESVSIETSSGHQRLDRAALDAVRRWKFVPARQGEQAVTAEVLVPIQFDLNPT